MKVVYRPLTQSERFLVTDSKPKWETVGPRIQRSFLNDDCVRSLGICLRNVVDRQVSVISTWHKHHESMSLEYMEE